jgi:hypothetical protein
MLHWVDAGWVDVPNPMFRHHPDPLKRLTHVSLQPAHVRAVVWWSKNYGPYLKLHEGFVRYRTQAFQFTINSRRPDLAWLEPDVPTIEDALRQVGELVDLRQGGQLISWRYDPICFWHEDGEPQTSWDPEFFADMCRALSRLCVRRCFTSFADRYQKVERRVKRYFPHVTLRDPDPTEWEQIPARMVELARPHGMDVHACTDPRLEGGGIQHGACIDGALLGASVARASDRRMGSKGLDRSACGCTLHRDIGDYVDHECKYACVYCYANPNHRRYKTRQPHDD